MRGASTVPSGTIPEYTSVQAVGWPIAALAWERERGSVSLFPAPCSAGGPAFRVGGQETAAATGRWVVAFAGHLRSGRQTKARRAEQGEADPIMSTVHFNGLTMHTSVHRFASLCRQKRISRPSSRPRPARTMSGFRRRPSARRDRSMAT
jgi:hypothetical protein